MRRLVIAALAAAAAGVGASPASAFEIDHDFFALAEEVSGVSAPDSTDYNLMKKFAEPGEPHIEGGNYDTAWYKWTPQAGGAAYADVCATPDHLVRAYRIPFGQTIALGNLSPVALGGSYNPISSTPCRARFLATAGVTYYVQIDRKPGAGYIGSLTINQDASPPAAAYVSPNWPGVTGPTTVIRMAPPSGVSHVQCTLDAKPLFTCWENYPLPTLADGPHTVTMRTVDAHGNVSPLAAKKWVVDAKAPTAAIGALPKTVAPKKAIDVPFTIDEAASTAECRVDGGAWTKCASPFAVDGKDVGTHSIEVRATDGVLNQQAVPAMATWKVVEPPPEAIAPTTPAVAGSTAPAAAPPQQAATSAEPAGRAVVAQPPVAAPCTLSLKAPKKVSRKALRKGLRKGVRLSVRTTGGCAAKVALKRRGKRVTVVATAGSLKRSATVQVR